MQSNEQPSRHAGFAGSDNDPIAFAAAAMFPASIIAHGAAAQPAEHLMGLQSGFSKLVSLLTNVRLPRLGSSLRQSTAPRLR